MVDPQGDQHSCHSRVFAALDGLQQVGDALLRHAVHREDLLFLFLQEVQVRNVHDQAPFDQGQPQLPSHALDVHGALADEVLQQPHQLGGAGPVATVGHRLALRPYDLMPAAGTVGGHLEVCLVARTPPRDCADDLRNHLPCPLDHDPVAHHEALGPYVVLVVQRGLFDGRPPDVHRLQDGVGVHASGPAHVHPYLQEACDRLGGGELVRHGPAGLPADDSQVAAKVEAVYLDHDPVAVVVQVLHLLEPLPIVVDNLLRRVRQRVVPVDLEAQPCQVGQGVPVVVEDVELGVAQPVDEDVQGPLRGAGRVQLAQGARGGVSRIGVGWQALGDSLLVEPSELGLGEVDLAPDLEDPGRGVSQDPERYALDGPEIQGHVLTGDAVAPGGAAHEDAVLVGEGYRQAIVLQLAHHVEGAGLQQVGRPGVPGHELAGVEGVGEAVHGDRVPHLGEPLGGLGADTLRRRLRRNQFRVLLLQAAQLPQQRVVLGVAYGRLIQDVVEVVVAVQLLPEIGRPLGGFQVCHVAASVVISHAEPLSLSIVSGMLRSVKRARQKSCVEDQRIVGSRLVDGQAPSIQSSQSTKDTKFSGTRGAAVLKTNKQGQYDAVATSAPPASNSQRVAQ